MSMRSVFRSADETRHLAAGQQVFAEGEEGHEMFGVISGAVALHKSGTIVATIGPEGTFGELALIDRSSRSLTAVATEDAELAVISERTFLFLVHETPTFALQVMRSLAERLRQLDPPA